MNGNVSPEGARLDLEWMQRIGLGGFHVFSGGMPGPIVVAKREPFMSDAWKATLRQSTATAHAAGMEVGIAGSPGWSETGGPWVKPEDGMKKYVWSETRVKGGRPLTAPLPAPPGVTGPFQGIGRPEKGPAAYGDSYIVAFRTPRDEAKAGLPSLSASDPGVDLAKLGSPDLKASVTLPVTDAGNAWVEARFRAPTLISAVTLGLPAGAEVELAASDDGTNYRTVGRARATSPRQLTHPLVQQTIAVSPTRARIFRVLLKPVEQPAPLPMGPGPAPRVPALAKKVVLSKVVFEPGARVNRFEAKAGFQPTIDALGPDTPAVAVRAAIPRSEIIDLTGKLGPDGRLDWRPPSGDWTILRFGWSLTGQTNGPAEPEATGLEVDKLDPDAVKRYIGTYLAMYRDATGGKLGPAGIQTLLTDSWEAGVQNWTPRMFAEFAKRRGYDPLPFLPVLAGRVVESADASDRFLWDFRQTIKDLVADNHQGVLAEAIHANGMRYYSEAQGDTPRAIADGMTLKARSDIPTAEFWYRPFAAGPGQLSLKADMEEAASAAHVYGKPLAAAESLTVAAATDPWSFSPAMLKPVADEIFAHGINRIIVHSSHHQPLPEAKPGLMLGIFGQFFNRNDTWAEEAKPWVDYLARTSYLLQHGRNVADVAYFYGEEKTPTELFGGRVNDDVPAGHGFDYINPEALLTLLSVKEGRLVTPGGASYRLLLLPAHVQRLSLPAAQKLRELVSAGAIVVGAKPRGGLGLRSPDADVLRIADELWGAAEGATAVDLFGKGRVYRDLAHALSAESIAPHIRLGRASLGGRVLTQHRRSPDADIYFLSNQSARAETLEVTFGVTGKAPELWRAETAAVEPLPYRHDGAGTTVPLKLAPHEAVFVVFARKSEAAQWAPAAVAERSVRNLTAPWSVSFQAGRGAPPVAKFAKLASWTESSDPGIRYFSGSATYSQTIDLSRDVFARGRRLALDLGDVRELAAVTVNGKPVGTAWHAPYRIDVTDALRPGKNTLEIRVTNLWPNRLIGDKQVGAKPIAFAPQSRYGASSPLLPSGLLGPVELVARDPVQ